MARIGLDRNAVVQEAAKLADEIGLEALTMAALARRLGIALPSLYAHVRSLEHVRQQIAGLAGEELAQRLGEAIQGRSRSEALAAIAAAYRDYVLHFPGRYAASMSAPDLHDPRHVAAIEHCVQVIYGTLRGYGLHDAEATDAGRVLRSALHGFATLEQGGAFANPQSRDRSFRSLVEALDRAFSSWPQDETASPSSSMQ